VRTREQLGVFEQRYRSLVEQVPAVAYVAAWDPDAPFVYVAPQIEDMLGFPPERWVEEPDLWERRLHPEDREAVIDGERRAFEEEAVLDREFRMVAADGAVVWVWERDTIVRGHDGRPSHTEGVLVDIPSARRQKPVPSTTSTSPARSSSSSTRTRPSPCSTATGASCSGATT